MLNKSNSFGDSQDIETSSNSKFEQISIIERRNLKLPIVDKENISYVDVVPLSCKITPIVNPFNDKEILVDISLYIGTKRYPRRTGSVGQFDTTVISVSFLIKTREDINISLVMAYLRHLGSLSSTQLNNINYNLIEACINNITEEDVKMEFGICHMHISE